MLSKEDKIIVTGVKGQLGYDVCRELEERGFRNVIGIDIEDLDITDEPKVKAFIAKEKPIVVIHNAAWTAVDKAEEYAERVFEVNALGPKYLAEACEERGAKMIFVSTDYVFPGTGETPYREDDPVGALGVYGRTKAAGETFVRNACSRHFIVRTSWVFGINGNNFIKTMLRLAETKKELEVVADQIGSPTYTYDLSKLLCDLAETDKYGTYHATNEGYCSWYEFAKKIFESAKISTVNVRPTTTETYQAKIKQAYRPLNSRLSKDKLERYGFRRLPDWENALKRYIENELKL